MDSDLNACFCVYLPAHEAVTIPCSLYSVACVSPSVVPTAQPNDDDDNSDRMEDTDHNSDARAMADYKRGKRYRKVGIIMQADLTMQTQRMCFGYHQETHGCPLCAMLFCSSPRFCRARRYVYVTAHKLSTDLTPCTDATSAILTYLCPALLAS